jgi:hypothetical protein
MPKNIVQSVGPNKFINMEKGMENNVIDVQYADMFLETGLVDPDYPRAFGNHIHTIISYIGL